VPYLTPEDLPEAADCRRLFIPANTEWLAIVSGALTELLKSWNWEQSGSVTVPEAVAAMQSMIDGYYASVCDECELPEGGRIIRLGEFGEFEELLNGAWQEPTGDYELPPIPAREDPTEEERKCLAAKNAINVLKLAYEDMTDSYNLDLDPAVALTVWAGNFSTVVLVALGFLSFSVGTVLFGMWTLMYQALEFLTEDVWDEEFDEKAVCALLLTASDVEGVVTFDWRQFMDNLALNVNLFDPSIGELRLFGQIWYMLSIIGADGLNQAGATTAITDADCSFCPGGGICVTFDEGDPYEFVPNPEFPLVPAGTLDTGLGNPAPSGQSGDNFSYGSYQLWVSAKVDLGEAHTVVEANFQFHWNSNAPGGSVFRGLYFLDASSNILVEDTTSGTTAQDEWLDFIYGGSPIADCRYIVATIGQSGGTPITGKLSIDNVCAAWAL